MPRSQTAPPPAQRKLIDAGAKCEITKEVAAFLDAYFKLSAPNALAVAKVARAYRDALWFGSAEPELGWLVLISAVECAANHEQATTDESPRSVLMSTKPELHSYRSSLQAV